MNEKALFTLLDKFSAGQAVELDLDDGTMHLILRKAGALASRTPAAVPAGEAGPLPSPAPGGDGAVRLGLPVSTASETGAGGELITSPIVATFYNAPGPEAPPFVRPGSRVKAGETLCILEAMKMMNHLEAEFDCEILAVQAGNGELVEYGQALFEVKRL
ncbi:MAG: acetyl-CoA carboxylase biotin carboxyl carrier protein [Treponema sp.]|jgi:acetyl-CoA carboxylase biotin carboxyl carrier protein|nr:acetyl-CoA carboxylase biotin carboxyl carrier protein [Treponema sp.]